MIKTKEDLRHYLSEDLRRMSEYGRPDTLTKCIKQSEDYFVWKVIKNVRYQEFYENNRENLFCRIMAIVCELKARRYARKYGISIHPHVFKEGLCIYHMGPIYFSSKASVGKNLTLRPMTLVATSRDGKYFNLEIGDNVELSMGVCILCRKIGRNAKINANAVVMTNVPPYAIVSGNPAKVIGFTMTPEDAWKNEVDNYSEEGRISRETLEKNYEKYYTKRLKEITEYIKL